MELRRPVNSEVRCFSYPLESMDEVKEYKIRPLRPSDQTLLWEMLYQANKRWSGLTGNGLLVKVRGRAAQAHQRSTANFAWRR